MQVRNEKEHQEGKEEQGKRQEEIIADFRLACPRTFFAGVRLSQAAKRGPVKPLDVP